MWFTGIVVVVSILANAGGTELEILDLINKPDICELIIQLGIPGKCGEQIKRGCQTKAPWLIYMIDATSKPQSGILEGNIADYGSFDECLKIDVPKEDVRGKYCLGTMSLSQPSTRNNSKPISSKETENNIPAVMPTYLTFALCLPDSCSADEIANFIPPTIANFAEAQCQTKSSQPTWTTGDELAISFFVIIGAVIIISTAYDYYLKMKTLKPRHSLLLAFSFLSNGRSLFKISKNPNQIQCIHGIRAISIMWVIIGHMFYSSTVTTAINSMDMYKWFLSEEGMFIMAATVSVDTFFMLSGMVMVYAFLKSKPNGGWFNVPMYYLHRYLRLTPSLAVVLLVHVTLIKHMGSGPLWPSAKIFLYDFCVEYWWSTLLYIQNWVNVTEMCLAVTWYLSVDMQLFLLSPLLLIPLRIYTKTTLSVIGLLTCASIAACFHAAWEYNLNGLRNSSLDYYMGYYMATYTRAAPWLIGTIVGYFMYEIKCKGMKFKPNMILVWGLWIASLAIMCTCVFAGNSLVHDNYDNRTLNSIYITFVRPSWALAISWIILACITDHGGPVNSILSFWLFQFIAKISYNLYLLHLSIMMVITFSTRAPTIFSPLWQIYFFWGHFIVICAISTIWTLAFESPIIILEKQLLGSGNKKEKEDTRAILTITDLVRKI